MVKKGQPVKIEVSKKGVHVSGTEKNILYHYTHLLSQR